MSAWETPVDVAPVGAVGWLGGSAVGGNSHHCLNDSPIVRARGQLRTIDTRLDFAFVTPEGCRLRKTLFAL
jgi:hypothetical protein